jgi:hypothetical protein
VKCNALVVDAISDRSCSGSTSRRRWGRWSWAPKEGEGGAQRRRWAWCPWRVAEEEEEVEAIIGLCGERRTELGIAQMVYRSRAAKKGGPRETSSPCQRSFEFVTLLVSWVGH